jgi:hypothetical protein
MSETTPIILKVTLGILPVFFGLIFFGMIAFD